MSKREREISNIISKKAIEGKTVSKLLNYQQKINSKKNRSPNRRENTQNYEPNK